MKNKEYVSLMLMTFFRYLGDCLFFGYIFLFLKSRGLTESLIGSITCLSPLVAILVNPIWNHFAKNVNISRKFMIGITIIEGILIFVFSQVSLFEVFMIVMLMISMFDYPFYSLHDGFTTTYASVNKKKYATIRVFGTTGYFVASLLATLILFVSNNNYNILLYCSAVFMILTAAWFTLIKPIDLSKISKDEKSEKRDYKAIFTNKSFWIFLIIDLLIMGINSVADQYSATYFTTYKSLSDSTWSLVYSGILLLEIIFMLFTTQIKKIKPSVALGIAFMCYIFRDLAFVLDLPMPVLIIAALLRGVAYGIYLPFLMEVIERICGIKNVTSAVFIKSTFTSILRSIGIFTCGHIIEAINYRYFFLIMLIFTAVGLVIDLIYQLKNKFVYPEYKEKVV